MATTISRIRECVRSLNYAVSLHAAEEPDDDNLTIFDLENIILTGEIIDDSATEKRVKPSSSSAAPRLKELQRTASGRR